ncbi:MAG TPA: type II toxin-antitoxin system RelE/ParE family toxin [Candidatus Limnocylindria bacterium]|nr:type II toxin-antitoxin system RelE/ParE family toxin [Candidatus Limnocylindria bacterium]
MEPDAPGRAVTSIGHRWRFYPTSRGRRPVDEFIKDLPDQDVAEIAGAMDEVRREGMSAARHLRGDIYEVRADAPRGSYRVLFSAEGKKGRILLALVALSKKSQRTPPDAIALAERRLRDRRLR